VVDHDPNVGHDLLPLAQPPDLIRSSEHEPRDGGGDESLASEENGDSTPGVEATGMLFGGYCDAVECQRNNNAPSSISRLEDERAGGVFPCCVPIRDNEVETRRNRALLDQSAIPMRFLSGLGLLRKRLEGSGIP